VENEVKITYDRRIKDYVNSARNITIDFRKDKFGSGFVILGGSTC
jgi:Fe-S cluster assembly iron-binding protein IscA